MVNIDRLRGADLIDQSGDKIGSIGDVYLDDQTGEPAFLTVNTGLFGMKETFVPYANARQDGENVVVPFEKSFVKDAPNIDADGSLSPQEEQEIYRYYNLDAGAGRTDAGRTDAGVGGVAGAGHDAERRHDHERHDHDRVAEHGHRDHDRAAGQQEVVAHEERLNVGKEQVESGKVRLRKHVVTEKQQVEVPVQREELVVEREAIDPNSAEARTAGGINERGNTEETITLREERPVVDKETVATEKVNVGKRVVEDTETVGGEVRKEQIDIDGEGVTDADARRDVDGRGRH